MTFLYPLPLPAERQHPQKALTTRFNHPDARQEGIASRCLDGDLLCAP
ncbi:MAG: hypothetical protein AB1547_03460 [Thermodesulfobacteriota bacterium]